MRDADIDLARLQARKDAVIARFQARAHVWQGLQAAALAALGVAIAGVVQGLLTPDQGGWLLTAGMLSLLAAAALLFRLEERLNQDLEELDGEMQMLKMRGSP